jgi:hypothetical protein
MLGATLVAFLLTAATATAAPQLLEGWHATSSPPSQVHAHEGFQAPMFQTISGCMSVPVTTLFHNNPSTAQWIRWSDGSNVKQVIDYPDWTPGAVFEATRVDTLNICQSQFDSWGWREVRVTENNGSPRDFGTTRWCVWVPNNGKSRSDYCGGPTVAGRCGGGWWYEDLAYSIVFVDCRDVNIVQTRNLVAGDKIRAHAQAGTLIARLDPDFHYGNEGTAAAFVNGAWTVPSGLAPGTHRLHMRDGRSNGEAGVYVLVFTV